MGWIFIHISDLTYWTQITLRVRIWILCIKWFHIHLHQHKLLKKKNHFFILPLPSFFISFWGSFYGCSCWRYSDQQQCQHIRCFKCKYLNFQGKLCCNVYATVNSLYPSLTRNTWNSYISRRAIYSGSQCQRDDLFEPNKRNELCQQIITPTPFSPYFLLLHELYVALLLTVSKWICKKIRWAHVYRITA